MSRLSRLLIPMVVSAGLLVVSAPPAFAACSFDNSNVHTVGSVNHGWERFFCQPANDYTYNVFTNHGHGTKYVALWHDGGNLHCDRLVSGSNNATCSDVVNNTSHHSFHDIAGTSCTDRFNTDGHGFNCHDMEGLP